MPRVKQFNEAEILQKAMCLFWRNGYHATSMQDLVDYLGINRASIYDTFGGKKTLFETAFSHYRTVNRKQLDSFFSNQESVKQGFKHLFEFGISEAVTDTDRKGCFVINVATELVPNDEEMLSILNENRTYMEGIFYDFLKIGVDKGEISKTKDLKAIASLLFTYYNGLKVVSKTAYNPNDLKPSVTALLTLLD